MRSMKYSSKMGQKGAESFFVGQAHFYLVHGASEATRGW